MRSYHHRISQGEPLYRVHPWKIIEKEVSPKTNHHSESIFTLGNGYQGVRGTFEEGYNGPLETSTPGVYGNGIYYSKEYTYEEMVPKEPYQGQTLINLPDWTPIIPRVGGEELDLLASNIHDYSRILHLKKGILERKFEWRTKGGMILQVTIIRMVSLVDPKACLITYAIKPLNGSGWISLRSLLNGNVSNKHHLFSEKILHLEDTAFVWEKKALALTYRVTHPISFVSCAMENQLENYQKVEVELLQKEETGYQFHLYLSQGKTFSLKKYIALLRMDDGDPFTLTSLALEGVKELREKGYHTLFQEQEEFLNNYWDKAHVKIGGDLALQQGLNFNLFQLLQSTGRDGERSVAAKGLSGEFYEGHYFWDLEIYMFPFFLFTWPKVSKALLSYRYKVLPQARENARRFHNKGALFAWRTINGEEASAYFMGSSIQCHINAAIAYAIYQYHQVTGDDHFLINRGAEILFETARYFNDRGFYSPFHDGQYVINVVCGPDEYKPGVNNNCYTNYMAAFNLRYAYETAFFLKDHYQEDFQSLLVKLALTEEEILEWKKCSEKMYRPFHRELGIHLQDDSFLFKEPLLVDELTFKDIPLVKNWHPLVIWRYQVIKQADVILLMFLLGEEFTPLEKRANFDFYEPKTTHDSSLSPAIYSIVASEVGYHEYATSYLRQTIRLDLDDYNLNTYQGLHMAAMGSSWMVITFGLAGMRLKGDLLSFNPYCPEDLTFYHFKIQLGEHLLEIRVDAKVTYHLKTEGHLIIYHRGKRVRLSSKKLTFV